LKNRADININELRMIPGSHLHFIGIGGSSMSGIAELALHRGYKVSGSDSAESDATARLSARGAEICIGHCSGNISPDCTLVIYTLAISQDNPEYVRAHELGIPTIERGTFLGAIAKEYPSVTAVAGTHGKTSTTSMLSSILITAEKGQCR
jgi:UDP-N-acetylmuramate--alanine ligase